MTANNVSSIEKQQTKNVGLPKKSENDIYKVRRRGLIVYGEGGIHGKLTIKDDRSNKKTDHRRGVVRGFSVQSRRRFSQAMGLIDQRNINCADVYFITLTYPGIWNPDETSWKNNLKALDKRMLRKYGSEAYFWKLEFQRRGAPHFHLILFAGKTKYSIKARQEWFSKAWFEVVGSGDERHLRAGTQVACAKSWKSIINYGIKHIGKLYQNPKESIGRIWGCRRKHLLTINLRRIIIPEINIYKVRRVLRRLADYKRCTARATAGISCFARWQTFQRIGEIYG